MTTPNLPVYLFDTDAEAEQAIRSLNSTGFNMRLLSLVGKGCHTEEQATGRCGGGRQHLGARRRHDADRDPQGACHPVRDRLEGRQVRASHPRNGCRGGSSPCGSVPDQFDTPDRARMTPSRFKAVSAASVPRSPVAAEPTVLPIATRRLWVSIALTLPLLLMAMHVAWPVDLSAWVDAASREFGWPRGARVTASSGLEALLATIVVVWGGGPFFVLGWRSFITWQMNMFSLITLGVSTAWLPRRSPSPSASAAARRRACSSRMPRRWS